MSGNAWADKAHSLDCYRWKIIRERHGRIGSLLRFARDAVIETFYGLAARARLASSVALEPCDFLLLQSSPRVILLQRKKVFIAALTARGHRVIETALPEMHAVLQARMLVRPSRHVPLRYYAYAAHAAWLVEKYQPRVLLNDRNGSLYSPFLRLALNAQGRRLVHLAHATTVEESRRLGMNDYDYYFLFGRSSLEALYARKWRLGDSTAVLAGSHMIDTSYVLPAPEVGLKTILILGLGPDKEKLDCYQATYQLLLDWAVRHPEYQVLVKAHPRSRMEFWKRASKHTNSIEVLPGDCTLAAALGRASVAINIMSNAVIEATLAGRPVLYVNCGATKDILSQAQFLGGKITSLDDLERSMQALEQDYETACQRSAAFIEYHLAYGTEGLHQNIHNLERLLMGQAPDAPTEFLGNTVTC